MWQVVPQLTAMFSGCDQTYIQQGSSSNPKQIQFITADNLPASIYREVVLNSVLFAVPAAVVSGLTPTVVEDIRENGVYRQPFDKVQCTCQLYFTTLYFTTLYYLALYYFVLCPYYFVLRRCWFTLNAGVSQRICGHSSRE